jgi:glycosidase
LLEAGFFLDRINNLFTGNLKIKAYDKCFPEFQYIHTYIHSMNPHVTNIRERGTHHKYTNIQNIYGAQYYKHFTLPYYRPSLHIKNSPTE